MSEADQLVIAGTTYVVKAVQSFTQPIVGYVLALCEAEIS